MNEDTIHAQRIRADYIVNYRGALIGHQFKSLAQTICFALYGLIPPDIFDCWLRLGYFMSLLWYPRIENIDDYCIELQTSINNLVDSLCVTDPIRIISKSKLHILLHLPEDVRRFGPAVSFSTELFERPN